MARDALKVRPRAAAQVKEDMNPGARLSSIAPLKVGEIPRIEEDRRMTLLHEAALLENQLRDELDRTGMRPDEKIKLLEGMTELTLRKAGVDLKQGQPNDEKTISQIREDVFQNAAEVYRSADELYSPVLERIREMDELTAENISRILYTERLRRHEMIEEKKADDKAGGERIREARDDTIADEMIDSTLNIVSEGLDGLNPEARDFARRETNKRVKESRQKGDRVTPETIYGLWRTIAAEAKKAA
ncbi:MAG: hypothetical protein V1921_05385 [Candidatus Altiarchaeota archaeon]